MTKKIMMGMVAIMMAFNMSAVKASAESEKAQEFKGALTEAFQWDEYSPCQIEMTQWLFDNGFDDCVVVHTSKIPVTVKLGRYALTDSVCMYFVDNDTWTAKCLRFYCTNDGEFVDANWNTVWGDNKKEYFMNPFEEDICNTVWFEW